MKKIILTCLMASALLSCKKKQDEEVKTSTPQNSIVYYVDGQETPKSSVDFNSDNAIIVLDPAKPNEVEVFTHIDQLGANLRSSSAEAKEIVTSYNKAQAIANSQETLDAMAEYEKTGELPATYTKYLETTGSSKARTETLLGLLYDAPTLTGASIPSTNYPFMPVNWGNRISSVSLFTISGVWFYDKNFFRGSNLYVKPGIQTANGFYLWKYGFDNRTSSVLHPL